MMGNEKGWQVFTRVGRWCANGVRK